MVDWISNPAGLASVMDGDAEIVTSKGYPWGVRCRQCRFVIELGEALIHVPDKEYPDTDNPICVSCYVSSEVLNE